MKKFFILTFVGVLLSMASFAITGITGPSSVCVGTVTTLTDSTTGGTWSSSNTVVGTVGSTSGIFVGLAAGTTTISYVTGTGTATMTITVNPLPAAITGTATLCVGNTTTLSDVTTGGSWLSGNTSIATVGSLTGVVTGVAAGTANIYYSSAAGCGASKTVTVSPVPVPITGSTTLCTGSTTALTDATSGGTWSSSNTAVATIGSTGLVTGVSAGTALIYYLMSGCGTYKIVTVTAAPAAITGGGTVCVGSSITLSDATGGGTWSSSASSVAAIGSASGIVTGSAAGIATISYSVSGCGSATTVVTVTAAPAAITGAGSICVGGSLTLSDATSGGTWISGGTSVATVGSLTGVVTGLSAGTANIYYSVAGCGGVSATVTVNSAPASITGPGTVCAGSTITLADVTAGGTWSSSNASVATIGSTGIVTGVAAGTVNIYYLVGGCGTYKILTVTATPAAITGTTTLCVGSATTLTDATGGGSWTSSNTSVATVGSGTGVVTGVATGTATIYYVVSGCGATAVTVNVTTGPAAIGGSSAVCTGNSITLTDATSGGAWSSSNTSVATVNPTSGVVTGVSAGVVTISYTIGGTCSTTKSVTVNAAPMPISGPGTVCAGSTITLTDSIGGGTWSSSNASVATIGATGVVTGVAAGTVNIYYLVGGCGTYKILTVTAAPAAITGSSSVCVGSSITLADATGGGTWISGNTSLATAGSATGIITGLSAGIVNIYYSVAGCGGVSKSITVNAAPAAISGSGTVCTAHTLALSDATAGGTWSSSNTSIATVGSSTGIVTGVATGVVTISYTVGGCTASKVVTVTPTAAPITGSSTICIGASVTLTDATGGGTWSSSNTSVATVGLTSGIVTGVAAGTVNIYYLTGGCGAYKIVTVSSCSGSIGGGISTGSPKGTSGGAPVVGMLVKLKYASTSAIVTQTYTDAAGMYSFTSLPDDSYFVYPEAIGYTTTPSATITITGAANVVSNINFKVNDGSKTIVPGATSVSQLPEGASINIYPNPAPGKLQVYWEGVAIGDATITVTDVAGREVSRTAISNNNKSGQAQLDLSTVANGIYIITVKSETVNYKSRVLISK